MHNDDAEDDLARRALLGDLESIRSLLGLSMSEQPATAAPQQRSFPVLRDIVASALQDSEDALETSLPGFSGLPDETAIPILTERPDGSSVVDWDEITAQLERDAQLYIDELVDSVLPLLAERLREALQIRFRQQLAEAIERARR